MEARKLTKKQKREFAIHYIFSNIYQLDGDNLGDIGEFINIDDKYDILEEIHKKAFIIGGNRQTFSTPTEILKYVQKHF